MKRNVVILLIALLLCLVSQNFLEARDVSLTKESAVDMTAMNGVFLGWVDMVPDDWSIHGYNDKAEWSATINRLNNAFQRMCQTQFLSGRTVTGANEKGDKNIADSDLYIKFSDVRIDYKNYCLYLSMQFIDRKTNTKIAVIPTRAYYGNEWGFERYLQAALDEVGKKIQVEILGGPLKGK